MLVKLSVFTKSVCVTAKHGLNAVLNGSKLNLRHFNLTVCRWIKKYTQNIDYYVFYWTCNFIASYISQYRHFFLNLTEAVVCCLVTSGCLATTS